MIPLSILDLAPVPAGGTAADPLNNSIDLVRVAERAGYLRYWVAEHDLVPGVASSSTPVLVALIASATERIRVGVGCRAAAEHPPAAGDHDGAQRPRAQHRAPRAGVDAAGRDMNGPASAVIAVTQDTGDGRGRGV